VQRAAIDDIGVLAQQLHDTGDSASSGPGQNTSVVSRSGCSMYPQLLRRRRRAALPFLRRFLARVVLFPGALRSKQAIGLVHHNHTAGAIIGSVRAFESSAPIN
jgi:hypothetical protein